MAEAQELREPQITEDQFDIWMASPVTSALLKCLEWKRLDEKDAAGSGAIVDSSNSDLTHAMIHRSLGRQDAYEAMQTPFDLLTYYEMVFIPEPEPEEEANE